MALQTKEEEIVRNLMETLLMNVKKKHSKANKEEEKLLE